MNAGMLRNKQHQEACLRKCKAARSMATRSRALVGETLKQMAQCCEQGDYEAVRARWLEAQAASRERQKRSFATLDAVLAKPVHVAARRSPESSRSNSPSSLASADVLRGSSSDESALNEAARKVGAKDTQTLASMAVAADDSSDSDIGAADVAPTSIGAWISQLKKEPASESEQACKFMLYEAYSVEVQSMRETLLEAHRDCQSFLDYGTAAAIRKEIARIDNREAMAISNDREWFVYHMMRVAEQNNLNMARTFESTERAIRFEGASEGPECPMCLEGYDSGQALTLGCCHQVCNKCWQHWTDVMRSLKKHPFCPVCSQPDFISIVQSEVTARKPLGSQSTSASGDRHALCGASEFRSDAHASNSGARRSAKREDKESKGSSSKGRQKMRL